MTASEVQGYLKQRLQTCAQHSLSDAEKEHIEREGLKAFLYKQITRKKFRKWKITERAEKIIETALQYCISGERRIVFRFPFGGYKLWRFSTAPEVDWAEFFAISHTLSYLAPIIAAHKAGIDLVFSSDDVFVERLNNIPKSDTQAYYESFQKLLDQFRKHLPKNTTVDMFRHGDLFETEEVFEKEFAETVEKIRGTWKSERTSEQLERNMKTSLMNIKWDGAEDLTKLSEGEKQKKVEQSIMYHDALIQMPTKMKSNTLPEKIHIFTKPYEKFVGIGSSKASSVSFWVGTGVLEKKGDEYLEHVLSINQYESIQDLPHEEHEIDLVPLKNFKMIKAYKGPLDFSK